jgi:predicted Na+-dependent transporter
MFLQFVVYPLMVFGMAYAFQLNQYDALGMLLIGTCPGGSRLFVVLNIASVVVAMFVLNQHSSSEYVFLIA